MGALLGARLLRIFWAWRLRFEARMLGVFRVSGLGFRVWGLGFRVWGLGCLGFRV